MRLSDVTSGVVRVSAVARADYEGLARRKARKYGVPEPIFLGLITQESGWRPGAVSPAGARGLTQVVPRFHPDADLSSPESQLDYGAKHLSNLWKQYGNWKDVLSVYNSGRPWARGKKIAETRKYVPIVLRNAKKEGGGSVTGKNFKPGSVGRGSVDHSTNTRNIELSNRSRKEFLRQLASNTEYPDPPNEREMLGDMFLNRLRTGDDTPIWKAAAEVKREYAQKKNEWLSTANMIYRNAQQAAEAYDLGRDNTLRIQDTNTTYGRSGQRSGRGGRYGDKVQLLPHGPYQGTQGPVQSAFSYAAQGLDGLQVTSKKRPRKNTASGNVSDHYSGNKSAFAYDIAGPVNEMDKYASRLVNQLSGGKVKNWGRRGGIYEKVINGIRHQVIWRDEGHYDHVHHGARRV